MISLWEASAVVIVLLGYESALADTINSDLRRDDARLERRVSARYSRVYLGELVKELGQLANVDLSADERTGASDEIVFVNLRDVPLATALDAIWSLFSYSGARWHWSRSGQPGNFTYQLTQPLAAKSFPAQLRFEIQKEFEAEADSIEAILNLSDGEQKTLVERNQRIKQLLGSPRKQDGLRLFFESIPRDARTSILRREREIALPIEKLSARNQAFVLSLWKDANQFKLLPDGTKVPVSEPKSISIYVDRSVLSVPNLFIEIDGIGGYNYLGGKPLESQYLTRHYEHWLLPGDSKTHQSETQLIGRTAAGNALLSPQRILQQRFLQVTKESRTPIIARLPRKNPYPVDPGPPEKISLGEYVTRIASISRPQLHFKWRAGILLLTNTAWIHDPPVAPWRLVKAVKRRISVQTHRFSLTDLIRIAGDLSPADLHSLSDEYKVMKALATWHPLFKYLAQNPDIAQQAMTETGLAIKYVESFLRDIPQLATVVRSIESDYDRVRISESGNLGGSVEIQILSKDRKVKGGAGFVNFEAETD